MIKKLLLISILFNLASIYGHAKILNPLIFSNDTCSKKALGESEKHIIDFIDNIKKRLFSKSKEDFINLFEENTFNLDLKKLKQIQKIKRKNPKAYINEIYKFIRKNGLKLKLKVPLDLDLSQKIIETLLNDSNLDSQVEFDFEYKIKIEPNFDTGHIYRHDTIVLSPEFSYSNMLKSMNYSGTLGASYLFTHTRKYIGHKSTDEFPTEEEYLLPVKKVLSSHPIFFKPRCNQSRAKYIINLKNNLNIPFSYEELDQFLNEGDSLTYQKRSILGLSSGVSNYKNFLKIGTGVQTSRTLGTNLTITKESSAKNTYNVKSFLDTTDSYEIEFYISTDFGDRKILNIKPIDKQLTKLLERDLIDFSAGKKNQLTFLAAFFLDIENPKYQNLEHLNKLARIEYNDYIYKNFVPSFKHISESFSFLTDLQRKDSRKEWLRKELTKKINPLIEASEKIKKEIDKALIKPDFNFTPYCTKFDLYPLSFYFVGIKDLEEYFSESQVGFSFLGINSKRFSPVNFYELKNDEGQKTYYQQTAINLKTKLSLLTTSETHHRSTYLLAETDNNKNIESFKTLGFEHSLSDADFGKINARAFRNEVNKILPNDILRDEFKRKLEPLIGSDSVRLRYKYLFNKKGFRQLQDKITKEFINKNPNYIKNLLIKCMLQNDPNYEDKKPCNLNNQFINYIDYKTGKGIFSHLSHSQRDELVDSFNSIDDMIDEVAQNISLILIQKDYFYKAIDTYGGKARRKIYKTKKFGLKLTNQRAFTSINNAKIELFNGLAGVKLIPPKTNQVNGSSLFFRKIAPIFLLYILNYSVEGSDYRTSTINNSTLDQYYNFYAHMRSSQFNIEKEVQFGTTDDEVQSIIQQIDFFEFNFKEFFTRGPICKPEQ